MTLPCLNDLLVYTGHPEELKVPAPYNMYINEANTPSEANVQFHVDPAAQWLIYVETIRPILAGQELLMSSYGPHYTHEGTR